MRKLSVVLILTMSALFAFACSSENGNGNNTAETTTPQETTPPEPEGQGSNPNTNNNNQNTNPDAGNNDTDAGTPVKEPTNQVECIAACEAGHPTAATNNHQLDNACFFGPACGNVCNNLGQGPNKFPDAVSAPLCNTAAANSYPIGTPSEACSSCLAATTECCNLWIAIFGSEEGQSLSKCAHDCWDKFPN